MSHTYNNKNTPGGRRRLPSDKRVIDMSLGSWPISTDDFHEERRQSIAQLRVAERLAEEQQAMKTGNIDANTDEFPCIACGGTIHHYENCQFFSK